MRPRVPLTGSPPSTRTPGTAPAAPISTASDQAVPEDEAQDRPFLAVLLRRGGGDDDALGVDHLAHDAAGAVGRRQQDLRLLVGQRQHAVVDQLAGRDRLQAAEQRVGRRVRAGQGDAQPAEQRGEQRVEPAGAA